MRSSPAALQSRARPRTPFSTHPFDPHPVAEHPFPLTYPPSPSDKPAADSCRGSSCWSPARRPRWLCARTASPASSPRTRSCTPLSGWPRQRSATPRRPGRADAGPDTSADTGSWCAGPPGGCWALPPCTAPHCRSRCCRTPAPRSRTADRRAPGKRRRLSTGLLAGL